MSLMNIKGAIFFFLIMSFNSINSQNHDPYKSGEWLKYKISYNGLLKAGEAIVELNKDTIDNKELFHVVAIGRTTGIINWFFKVNDRYESYFNLEDTRPYKFIRNIYSNNIVELFNLHPRIIADLCNHSEIGYKKLLQILKLNQ